MKYLFIILLIPIASFAAKDQNKDKMLQKVKSGDQNINIDGYIVSANEKALLELIEELEDRILELEKKVK